MPTMPRTSKSPEAFELQPSGRSTLLNKIYVGFVKDTRDDQHMGRIKVWIPEIGGDPNNPASWVTVTYASPFAGATDMYANTKGNSYLDSQRSYGMWFIPPDLNNEVVCCFINGDPGRGIWFACLYQQNMNHMVPGIPGDGSNNGLPVVEYNKLNKEIDPNNPTRPVFTTLADALTSQGLDGDDIRGISKSGARRENPSKVSGFLTPGGSQLVFDDDPTNTFIRLRTSTGSQLLISNTTGEIYMISNNGNNWFRMSSDGTVNLYGANDINIRTERSLNLRADLDVNIEAGRNMNIKARGESTAEAATDGGGHIKINSSAAIHMFSEGEIFTTSESDTNITSKRSIFNYAAADCHVKAGASTFLQGDTGDVDLKAQGEIHMTSTIIHLNSVPAADASSGIEAKSPVEFQIIDRALVEGKYAPTMRTSILYNIPHHEPYDHSIGDKTGETDRKVTETDSSADPRVRITRPGDIYPNSPKPPPIRAGAPKEGMPIGNYEGVGFDENGNPIYRLVQDEVSGNISLNPVSTYSISPSGASWIKATEKIFMTISPDPPNQNKTFAIGYGHQLSTAELNGRYVIINNERVSIERGIRLDQAEELFKQDVRERGEKIVKAGITVRLTQPQFDALVSFAYNTGAMKGTDLAKAINSGNFQDVPKGFLNWTRAGGVVLNGLVSRRRREAVWFLTGVRPPTG